MTNTASPTFTPGSSWLCEERALEAISAATAAGRTNEEIRWMLGVAAEPSVREVARQAQSQPGAVVVLPMFGMMLQHSSYWGTSSSQLARQIEQASQQAGVSAIVLHVHSPGGSVYGVQELGDVVYQARQRKPIIAVADSMAASAAYWVASQATELVITNGGEVGSIGVLMIHQDVSQAAEKFGVKTTLVATPARKVLGNPYEPLSDDARAEFESKNKEVYERFVGAVARGRGVPAGTVKTAFGGGGMVDARKAVAVGMADRISPFMATVNSIVRRASVRGPQAGAALPTNPLVWRNQARLDAMNKEAWDTSAAQLEKL